MTKEKRKLNIKIVTNDPFPVGMANTNRILSYAKGLTENNCNVCVLCMKPTEKSGSVFNTLKSGTLDGFYFEYSAGKTLIDSNYIRRQLDNFKGAFNICVNLLREKKSKKTDAIIYYTTSTPVAFLLFIITRIKNIIFLKEESEFPFVYTKNMSFTKKYLYNKLHYTLFDGMLLMTKKLIHYFSIQKGIKAPFVHIPMTVDFERFRNLTGRSKADNYIAYCGSLNNQKDGIDILINAFVILAKDYPDISLYLIGDFASKEEENLYIDTVNENKLANRIVFKGRMGRNDVTNLLSNAKILVLPRPQSLQAEGGFPTKLGEYLSTGKPVITTSVGEIPEYLTDDVNAFIVEPGNIKSIIDVTRKILNDYPHAISVGANGQEVVFEHFNYKIQTKAIVDFIGNLKNRRQTNFQNP